MLSCKHGERASGGLHHGRSDYIETQAQILDGSGRGRRTQSFMHTKPYLQGRISRMRGWQGAGAAGCGGGRVQGQLDAGVAGSHTPLPRADTDTVIT